MGKYIVGLAVAVAAVGGGLALTDDGGKKAPKSPKPLVIQVCGDTCASKVPVSFSATKAWLMKDGTLMHVSWKKGKSSNPVEIVTPPAIPAAGCPKGSSPSTDLRKATCVPVGGFWPVLACGKDVAKGVVEMVGSFGQTCPSGYTPGFKNQKVSLEA